MATNNNEILIPLEGVDSEHCALIVDKGIAQLKGVSSHRVELNNKRAVIQITNQETVSEAVKTIRDLGYDVTTVKEIFSGIANDLCILCCKR